MDIFISYASEQRSIAEEIAIALREESHRVFFDRSDLPKGDAYNERIREGIREADLLVFLVSPESVTPGRYTLTELDFAQEKWPAPGGHVLPVIARETPSQSIPAYLRAVVMLRPAGSLPAEVVSAVAKLAQPPWHRMGRYALVALVLILAGAGAMAWRAGTKWHACSSIASTMNSADLQRNAGDYAGAFDSYSHALAVCPDDGEATVRQQQLAMEWLENIHASEGKSFTDIVSRIRPALLAAAAAKDNQRSADALAHLGWADFLRQRDGTPGLDPAVYYRQALERDPANTYAHVFWGHYILTRSEALDEAKSHFTAALNANKVRPFVRSMMLAGLFWHDTLQRESEAVRTANDMRIQNEGLPRERLVSRLWSIYYDGLRPARDSRAFLSILPASDHLATFRWLFPGYERSDSNRSLYLFMLAQLQEASGAKAEALTSYRALLAQAQTRGTTNDSMSETARQAARRLQPR